MNRDPLYVKLKREVKIGMKKISSMLYIDRCKNDEDIILLASMGRSGSTLVSKIITSSGQIRSYHEPFHPKKVPYIGNKLPHGIYFDPALKKENEYKLFRKVFDGKVYNYWISSASNSFYFNKRLIKAIRINLLLPWVKRNFPSIKIIILIKNPFSVIDSWLNMKFGNGDAFKKQFFEQESLRSLVPESAVLMYNKAESPKEKLLFQWCIEYYILFTNLKEEEYKLVVFESLLSKPEEEVMDLFNFIGRPLNNTWKSVIKKPSMTTSKNSDVKSQPGKISEKWRENWTEEEIRKSRDIMKIFNMDFMYAEAYPTKQDIISQLRK